MKTTALPRSRVGGALEPATSGFAPERVVVPFDFTSLAETALQRAMGIAHQFGSEILLVSVVEPIVQPVEFAIVPSELQDINIRQMTARKERLTMVKDRVSKEGLQCSMDVKLGRSWHVIVDSAKRWKADLIVIPTHGRKGPKHFLLGSTAERVVQHAPCSVLVVR